MKKLKARIHCFGNRLISGRLIIEMRVMNYANEVIHVQPTM